MKTEATQRSPLEILIFALTDSENYPHQFVDDAEALAIALIKTGITGKDEPQICPHWGNQPGGRYGACNKCLNCLVRNGAFEREESRD